MRCAMLCNAFFYSLFVCAFLCCQLLPASLQEYANENQFQVLSGEGGGLALFPTHPIPSDGRDREQSTSNGGLIRHEKTLYS